jgi:hypothetical protein
LRQEIIEAEFERKKREAEELANSKTAKNRAKRQKKKERSKKGTKEGESETRVKDGEEGSRTDAPLKKRRLVNGQELVFRQPGEESDEDEDEGPSIHPGVRDPQPRSDMKNTDIDAPPVVDLPRTTIHEDD